MSTPLCITIKTWNKENYNKFVKYLLNLQDVKYKDFHSSLVLNSKYEMIGIRVPIMRDVAKKISKSNIEEFLEYAKNKYYEEVMIQGLIISHIKDEKMFYKHFIEFIKKIDNWAICDSFCSSIKLVRNYDEIVALKLTEQHFETLYLKHNNVISFFIVKTGVTDFHF